MTTICRDLEGRLLKAAPLEPPIVTVPELLKLAVDLDEYHNGKLQHVVQALHDLIDSQR